MNDEFLHRLRTEPPRRFVAKLKSHLDALPSGAARRSPALRNVFVALMLGGAAFAVTAISIRGLPTGVLNIFHAEADTTRISSAPSSVRRNEAGSGGPATPGRAGTPRRLKPSREPTDLPLQPHAAGNESRTSAQSAINTSDSTRASGASAQALPPETTRIAVSAATLPFAEAVASRLRMGNLPAAKIENLGNEAALAALCTPGSGINTALVSRRMTRREFQVCDLNSVVPTHESVVGRQAVVLAQNIGGPELKLTTREIFLALAKLTPRADDPRTLVGNQATMWWQIGVNWGYQQIQVLGPTPDSPAGNALVEVLMDEGCRALPSLQQMLKAGSLRFDSVCRAVRADGLYVDFGANQKAMEQKVRISPGALGLFTYVFFDTNRDGLTPVAIDGVAPNAATIASGTYPGSRALYLYVRGSSRRVASGLNLYLMELEEMASSGATLSDLGLVAPADPELRFKSLSAQDLPP